MIMGPLVMTDDEGLQVSITAGAAGQVAVARGVFERPHQGRCCASANALKYDSPGFSATAARFERWESMDNYIYEANVTGSNGRRERKRALIGRLWFRGQATVRV